MFSILDILALFGVRLELIGIYLYICIVLLLILVGLALKKTCNGVHIIHYLFSSFVMGRFRLGREFIIQVLVSDNWCPLRRGEE